VLGLDQATRRVRTPRKRSIYTVGYKAERARGVLFSRPFGSNSNEFVGVSVWKDLSDVKAFAGSDWEKSVIPADELPLLETTSTNHYELFYVDDPKTHAEPSRIQNVEDRTRTSSSIPSGNLVEPKR